MNRRELTEFSDSRWHIKEYDSKGNYIKLESDAGYIYHLEYDENNIIARAWYEGYWHHNKKKTLAQVKK